MSKILAIIGLPAGIVLGLDYFKILELGSIGGFEITMLGALLLIAIQVLTIIMHKAAGGESKPMSFAIPVILALPGILYFIVKFLGIEFPIDPQVVIAAFLFTEGLYALH